MNWAGVSQCELRRARPLLGTLVEVSVTAESKALANAAVERAFAAIAAIERSMSFFDRDSDLSRFNRARVGAWVPLPPPLRFVLGWAERMRRVSDGRFDVACGPALVNAGLRPSPSSTPLALDGSSARYRLAGRGAVKLGSDWIDLGGIAKGYAVDQALEVLVCNGAKAALINAGGDLAHRGPTPVLVDCRSVDDPSSIRARVQFQNAALASSSTKTLGRDLTQGSSSLVYQGKVVTPARAVTVAAGSCLIADAMTKVLLANLGDGQERLLARFGARTLASEA